MGSQEKIFHRKDEKNLLATDMFSEIPSEARRQGRRLALEFISPVKPALDRIEFQFNKTCDVLSRQRGDQLDGTNKFDDSGVTKVISIFFLDHLCAQLKQPPKKYILEGDRGSLASTLGYALDNSNGKWGSLFRELSVKSKVDNNRIKLIFGGDNFGKPQKHVVIYVNTDHLPADCIEIIWHGRQLKGLAEIQHLTDKFRKAWNLPPPTELDLPVEQEPVKPASEKKAELDKPPKPNKVEPDDSSKPQTPPPPPKTEPAKQEPLKQERPKQERPKQESTRPPKPPLPKIDPRLFEIHNPDELEWKDSDPLINFGHPDSEADVWRIRDASEGLLIFGAVGSGKTSASGWAVGQAYLQAGYGGLILTAKTDEAARWLRLCERNGRAADCIHIHLNSGHKLNVLQYEVQRPGERPSVTDELIELFRCLIGVVSRSKTSDRRDDFWTTSRERVLGRSFDVFLLAGETFTLDALIRFIECAPTSLKVDWKSIPYFADMLERARTAAEKGTDQDKDDFQKAFHYWTQAYPAITPPTRSGIITGVTAMADMLNGRGIREIIGAETNITPEQILSGKIVILDFPVRESARGGLMLQAAWKLLFQQAIERRADKGKTTARPVFLWEDEGHEFFSQHDVRFQPTARDCRVSHVILSQNHHNFLHLGHDQHAVYAVFAAINTYILHTNFDHETNQWASERIGNAKGKRMRSGGMFRSITPDDISIWPRRPEDNKSIGTLSFENKNEPAFRPEEFSRLKRGGDGTCEAVILWLSHQFECNEGKSFCRRTFAQEPR